MQITIRNIIEVLESWAPSDYQENYDNARLIVGDKSAEVNGVLVCLDCVEQVVDEAISKNCNLIVMHHPIVFSGLKGFTGANYIERVVIKAIQNKIALYAIHTNLDNVTTGVNAMISGKLGLLNSKILDPKRGLLSKLVVYGVANDIAKIANAVFAVGGGAIGEYSECSFVTDGEGSFKPSENANPTIGQSNVRQIQSEQRAEFLINNFQLNEALSAARKASSYEELAYDIIPISNANQQVGSGMVGDLKEPMEVMEFLRQVKTTFNVGCLRYTNPSSERVHKVAVCGGSGSFLLNAAKRSGADIFITADYKYHQFFDADSEIMIADIGHYESEQFTISLIADYLKQKFHTFAVLQTQVNTNPVNYL